MAHLQVAFIEFCPLHEASNVLC